MKCQCVQRMKDSRGRGWGIAEEEQMDTSASKLYGPQLYCRQQWITNDSSSLVILTSTLVHIISLFWIRCPLVLPLHCHQNKLPFVRAVVQWCVPCLWSLWVRNPVMDMQQCWYLGVQYLRLLDKPKCHCWKISHHLLHHCIQSIVSHPPLYEGHTVNSSYEFHWLSHCRPFTISETALWVSIEERSGVHPEHNHRLHSHYKRLLFQCFLPTEQRVVLWHQLLPPVHLLCVQLQYIPLCSAALQHFLGTHSMVADGCWCAQK